MNTVTTALKIAAVSIFGSMFLGLLLGGLGVGAAYLVVTHVEPPEGMFWVTRVLPGPFGSWLNAWMWAAAFGALAFLPSTLLDEWRDIAPRRRQQ